MKRVLMVSPHFPPDSSAATHRLRVLAPHLAEFGWIPTIVTVEPASYESRLDRELLETIPADLEVARVAAIPATWSRILRVGDLGIRAFPGLLRACRELISHQRFDCFFVTIYPTYPALLGPLVKKLYALPFVLDYQDPWVGSWGKTTGPNANGGPNFKSRLSRTLASLLEPIAVRAADVITAVSEGTFREVQHRVPEAAKKLCVEIPIGAEPADFEYLQRIERETFVLEPRTESFHLSYVGTLLPAGRETLRAFLDALSLMKMRRSSLYARLRVHFIGTSNQSVGALTPLVLPQAQALEVSDIIEEMPERVTYFDALSILVNSDALLLLGSSERHYTASKLYPALMARRPILAVFHEQSSVVAILRDALPPPAGRLVTFDDVKGPVRCVEAIFGHLVELLERRSDAHEALNDEVIESVSARSLAQRMARALDAAVTQSVK